MRQRSFHSTLFHSAAFARALDARLRESSYDVVQCEFAHMAQYRRSRGGPPWVLDEHNVGFRLNASLAATARGTLGLLYSAYARRELARQRVEEINACRRADHVLAVSEVDRDVLLAEMPNLSITVAPNGVDLERFTPSCVRSPSASGAVFVGKMDYRPNIDAMQWFCSEILPVVRRAVPDFSLSIVGGKPAPDVRELIDPPHVLVTGRVADTRPYLRGAGVVVAPLRAGGGTRLKILEALAAGCAVVTTSVGCEGLATIDGQHLLVADEPLAFAERVVRVLRNPAERLRLGRAGRRLVEERYGWPSVVKTIEGVHERLTGGTAMIQGEVRCEVA
jgi:glycosyltransferase involved in cell wall biosynthesis